MQDPNIPQILSNRPADKPRGNQLALLLSMCLYSFAFCIWYYVLFSFQVFGGIDSSIVQDPTLLHIKINFVNITCLLIYTYILKHKKVYAHSNLVYACIFLVNLHPLVTFIVGFLSGFMISPVISMLQIVSPSIKLEDPIVRITITLLFGLPATYFFRVFWRSTMK